MTFIRDVVRQYWTHVLAIVAFVSAAVHYWRLGNHFNEPNVLGISLALAGLVLVLQGDEWTASPLDDSERLTRDPNWSQRRSFTYRTSAGQICGAIALIAGTIILYRL